MEEARRIIQKHIIEHLNKSEKYNRDFNERSKISFDCLVEHYKEASIAEALNAVLAEIGLLEVLTSDK